MSEKFCKLFEVKGKGQILVKMDMNAESQPEVRMYAQPEGLGVCSIAVSFSDDDTGWENAEKWFAKVDEALALQHTKIMFDMTDGE